MRSLESICALLDERRRNAGPLELKQIEVEAAYGGGMAIPLPELDRNEKSSVANLTQQAMDGTAQRIASTIPDLTYPPEKNSKRAEQQARDRRLANLGWWEEAGISLILGQRARHLVGMGLSPVVIRPDDRLRIPVWSVRKPLGCYPAEMADQSMVPDDCLFTYTRTVGWMLNRYPERSAHLTKQPRNATVSIVEYISGEQITLLATATNPADTYNENTPTDFSTFNVNAQPGRWATLLEHTPNRAERSTVVIPHRVTLTGKVAGQFDGMLGLIYNKARLAALELIAIEDGIFPKQWLVYPSGQEATVVTMADGRQGTIGRIEGGELITQTLNPGYKTTQAIDRIEREARLEGAIPAEWGGESGSNIRTARRGSEVMSEAVDYRIAENQRLFERSLEAENRAAVAVAKGWFGKERKSFYVSWKGTNTVVDYTPDDLFTTDHNRVRYAMAGADFNGLAVRTGQLVGTGMMSKTTARRQNPEIEDADREEALVVKEGLEQALLSGIQQQAATGQIPPSDIARLTQLVVQQGMDLPEAVQQVQTEAQQRQAAVAEAEGPEAPVDPMSPEAQPGIAVPGAGAEAGTLAPIPEAGEGEMNLNGLLGRLGRVRAQANA